MMSNTILIETVSSNCMKNNYIFKFEFIFDFFITKYESLSALILKSKKQINSNNVINLLKKILNFNKKNNLINFDKNFQNLLLLIKKNMKFLYIYTIKNLNICHDK